MSKRKILTLALTVCMVAILAIGGSLAYLTDTDQAVNVFTTGNVKIDLIEDFGDNNDETLEKLLPTTGYTDETKYFRINGIEKEIYVENEGSEPAYVRIHLAIPDIIDSGAKDHPALDASDNIVHWNMAKETIVPGTWSWLPTYTEGTGYEGNGEGNWNVYQITINEGTEEEPKDVTYNVYVATYRTALKGVSQEQKKDENGAIVYDENGEPVMVDVIDVTPDAIYQVFMDEFTTNEQIATIKEELGDEWHIYVAAEACQSQGFENAYEALNRTFGDPSAEDYETAVDWSKIANGELVAEDDTLVEKDGAKELASK